MAASRAARAAAVVGVFLLAAAYFALGATLGVEWTDEGQIVYPSWLAAQGALPYHDFRHGYGPSLFLWNGLLFRVFGADLLVIRISLVLLKAAVAVLVLLLARRVTTPGWALAATALLVALWGGPWWVFNAPYANHYAIALNLLALLAALAPRRLLLGCALAGFCCGIGATFKQTSGVFSFAAIVLFILCEPYVAPPSPVAPPIGGSTPRWCVRTLQLLRAAALLGALGLFAGYLAPAADAWTAVVLLTPIGLTLAILGRSVWQHPAAGDARRTLSALSAVGLGFAAAPLAYAAYYGAHGWLAELIFDVAELLPLLRWYDPLPGPPPRATLMLALLLLAYAGLATAARDGRVSRSAAGLAIAAGALAAVIAVAATWGGSEWYLDAFRLLFLAPFAVTALSLTRLLRPAAGFWNPPGVPTASRRPLALLHLNASISLLYMYPAADFWHLAMIWPAFLPLLGHQLACAHAAPRGAPAVVWASRGLAAFVVLGLMLPQVAALASTRRTHAAAAAPFARASHITGTTPQFAQAAQLVQRLDALDPRREPVLITTNEQMLYFLAGRLSPVSGDEFTLYLAGAGLIDDRDAHRLLPEPRLVERLRSSRARVVDIAGHPMAQRVYRTYPGLAALLAAEYELETTVGTYSVLRRKP